MNFDWQTDEDEDQWENKIESEAVMPARPRWPWLAAGLVVLLIIAGVALAYLRLEQRAEAVTKTIETDVLTAHALVQQAAQRGDGELFSSLLSSSDPAWSAAQRQLFEHQVIAGEPFWGLAAGVEPAERVAITLSPDLQTAVLTATRLFTVTAFNSPGQTVRLQEQFVYRLEADRWLLASPPAEFWGRPVVNRGPRLTITYPERDAEVGERLAVYLEQLATQLCAPRAGLLCPAEWQLTINLAAEPDALLETALQNGREMKLPTPSLLGAPLDEAGYTILRRTYGRALATSLILEFGGEACCGQGGLAEAFLAWQLHVLDLQPWPLRPADYQLMWQNPVSLPQTSYYWAGLLAPEQSDLGWRPLYALVEFWSQTMPELSPLVLRRLALESPSYEQWQELLRLPDQFSDSQLDEMWLDFNDQQLAAAGAIAPIDRPAEDLLLTCRSDPSHLFDLVRFDLETGGWQQVLGERDFYALYNLPDGSGAMLMDQIAGLGGPVLSRVTLWQDGREQTVYTGPAFYYYSGQTDASGQQLLLQGVMPEDGGQFTAALNLASCAAAPCVLHPATAAMTANATGSPDVRLARIELLAAVTAGDGNVQAASPDAYSVSPDGRWLTVNVTPPALANALPLWEQYLYDTRLDYLSVYSFDATFIYPEQDWSADGRWLVRLGDGFILLSAPGHNYQQLIVHPFFDCTNVIWIPE
jgi:hypothetical protein